jgi:hypothetical protein
VLVSEEFVEERGVDFAEHDRRWVIWKFALEPGSDGRCAVSAPRVREFLRAGEQGGGLVFWAVVDPGSEQEVVWFDVVGTGWDLPVGAYRDTVQAADGLVWHVFEVPRDEG